MLHFFFRIGISQVQKNNQSNGSFRAIREVNPLLPTTGITTFNSTFAKFLKISPVCHQEAGIRQRFINIRYTFERHCSEEMPKYGYLTKSH
jgi:hypothetical protein